MRRAVYHRSLLCAFTLMAGCQAGGGVLEDLSSTQALNIVAAQGPVTFARTQGQFSRTARDYVYLGPVALASNGTTQYYWWVGMASTIDRNFLAAEEIDPDLLVLEIGGAPVEFDLEPWDVRIPGVDGRTVYDTAVAPSQVLAARVTRDQIARISTSPPDEVRIVSDGGATTEYSLWRRAAEWSAFVRRAAGAP